MILVFAGQENSPVLPGMHHLIGTCDSLAEATSGIEVWIKSQRSEWLATLARCHPMEQAQAIVRNARFWTQFVEHRPGQDPEYVIIQEHGKPGLTYSADAELHAARQTLLAFDREEQQATDGDPGQAEAENQEAMRHFEVWRAEFAKTKEPR